MSCDKLTLSVISGSAGAHRGHISARSARRRRELPRSRPHVKWHVGCIGRGQADPGTRPGLQADSPSRSRIPATSRWHTDRHVQVPIPRLRSSSRHRRTRVVHDRRERGIPLRRPSPRRQRKRMVRARRKVPIPRLRSPPRHRRTRVVHDRRERGIPLRRPPPRRQRKRMVLHRVII